MKFKALKEAIFIERLNRFVARVGLENGDCTAYIRNTGRLTELLTPGNRVYVTAASGKHAYEIVLAQAGEHFVCIDSHLAPKIYAEGLSSEVRYEPVFGQHRFDLLIDNRPVEVKSVNLVKDRRALFPDAPTARGRKHIQKLIELSKEGYRPLLIFIVQRPDAELFSPNWGMDRPFSEALLEYINLGLEVRAYRCSVSLEEIKLKDEIPVIAEE